MTLIWTDNNKKKANSISQTWIIECLKIFKILEQVVNFIVGAMENWKEETAVEGQILVEVRIQRDMFPGDSLSSLPFITAMMQLNHLLMKFTKS